MPANHHAQSVDPGASTALLVLGMHRSGTSALARMLQAAGADVGDRLVPGSAGNEQGHWEDAFAVETNERLLAALGRRWDDMRPLPAGWAEGEAACEARERISRYVRGNRRQHPLWAIKDPRMCLFAALWRDAIVDAGCAVSAVLLARHPREVAASLASRDGMAEAQSDLLWTRHMLEAERATRATPRTALTYDALLEDPDAALAQLRALPGAASLHAAGDAGDSVQRSARHHRGLAGADLPPPLDRLWAAFAADGIDAPRQASEFDAAAAALAAADRLYAPVLEEVAREHATLWQRAARAEAAIAELALAPDGTPRRELDASLDQLREGVSGLAARMTDAISVELRRMQGQHAKALASASELAGQAALARDLVPGFGQLREAVAVELHDAVRRAEERQAEVLRLQHELEAARALAEERHAEALRLQHELEAARVLAEERQAEALRLQDELEAGRVLAEERHAEALHLQHELDAARALAEERDARIALLEHERSVLQADAELLRQIRDSRSWRLTRPLRFGARLLRGQATGEDRARIERWWARQLAALPFLPRAYRERKWREGRGSMQVAADGVAAANGFAPGIAEAAGDKSDVFMWAVIDWHFRTQRPQHLARGLAEDGHRVFYLSNNLVDDAQPGFRVEPLDGSGRLFQVFLHAAGAPAIYHGNPPAATVAQLRRSAGELMQWAGSDGGLCIVQHPFWRDIASRLPGTALLYDCMDHHAGFADNAPDVLVAESALAREADLLVVTSEWLDREYATVNPNRALVRNACDFEHFRTPPAERFRDREGRRIIGYYGAIADWFDVDLVRAVARSNRDCLVLLVGSDTAGVAAQLEAEPNVAMTGEVPYARLPYYLHAFDVAMLPFRVIPLTLATNPVKVYEYLAAGKPVVSVDLPEMQQFGDLVHRATGSDAFVAGIRSALDEPAAGLPARRQAFASEQTWVHRAEELDAAIESLPEPLASVIVLAYNNLDFTKACLRSVEAETRWRNLEIIVVDNASTDGTREFLREWEAAGPGRRAILNDANLGFSAGNNVGLAAARGDYLVLLNNDTYVTRNWLRTMLNHIARNPGIGLLGPVTNNIGNEARIEIQYADMAAMQREASAWTRRHAGGLFDLPTVAFFCVAMPRSTYQRVGPLDEAFGVGFFEDDDYCRRVTAEGLRVACAEDVFVHHHLSASFDALGAARKQALFERNKAIYEAKWGPWEPHAYRERT